MALGLDSADIEHSILLDFYTPSRRPSETCQGPGFSRRGSLGVHGMHTGLVEIQFHSGVCCCWCCDARKRLSANDTRCLEVHTALNTKPECTSYEEIASEGP